MVLLGKAKPPGGHRRLLRDKLSKSFGKQELDFKIKDKVFLHHWQMMIGFDIQDLFLIHYFGLLV